MEKEAGREKINGCYVLSPINVITNSTQKKKGGGGGGASWPFTAIQAAEKGSIVKFDRIEERIILLK